MKQLHRIGLILLGWAMLGQASLAQNSQGQIDLTAFGGYLIPLANVVDEGGIAVGSEVVEHKTGFFGGGRLTYWFRAEMGVELEVFFSSTGVTAGAFGIPGEVGADFLTGSLRLVYDFGSDPAKPSFLLTGGLGIFTTAYDSPLDMTAGGMGLVGLGLKIPLGTALSLRLDVTDYITTARWELNPSGETDRKFQNDLALTGGLTLHLNR